MPYPIAPVITCTLTVRDREGSSSFQLYFLNSVTPTQITTWLDSFIPAFEAVSNGQITAVNTTYSWQQEPLVQPAEYSEVQRKLGISFVGDGFGVGYRLELPSVLNEIIVDGTPYADPNNAAFQSFIDMFIAPAAGSIRPTDNEGRNLNDYTRAQKFHRRSSSG